MVPIYISKGFYGAHSANAYFVCQALGSLIISALVSRGKRKIWARHRYHRQELQRLLEILFDLVPPQYSLKLVAGCGSQDIPISRCRVVALQLDLCGFTSLSQTVGPMELALALNALFSEVDEAVITKDLFKIDTIGDAYIIVGFLGEASEVAEEYGAQSERRSEPRPLSTGRKRAMKQVAPHPAQAAHLSTLGESDPRRQNGEMCVHMLQVADTILKCLDKHSRLAGIPLEARVGIATGEAVCGILGTLQPRFSVQGEAISFMASPWTEKRGWRVPNMPHTASPVPPSGSPSLSLPPSLSGHFSSLHTHTPARALSLPNTHSPTHSPTHLLALS